MQPLLVVGGAYSRICVTRSDGREWIMHVPRDLDEIQKLELPIPVLLNQRGVAIRSKT